MGDRRAASSSQEPIFKNLARTSSELLLNNSTPLAGSQTLLVFLNVDVEVDGERIDAGGKEDCWVSGGDTGPTDDGVDVVDELDCLLDMGEAGLTSLALVGSTLNAATLACGLSTACLACGLSAAGLIVAAGESSVVGLCVEVDTLPLGV